MTQERFRAVLPPWVSFFHGASLGMSLSRMARPSDGIITGRLRDRVCYLRSDEDWDCLANLIKGVDVAIKDSREMLVKCHPSFIALKPLPSVLDDLAQHPKRTANHLKGKVHINLNQ